ncbi:MAG: DUF2207 domain-containing protein, partial [Endomicrobium sp.]|nr:DUF2207 domain-containing protein [Endomicrobium sp.]
IFAFAAAGFAQEKILNFVSEMTAQSDGFSFVTETITVNAENIQIRRGIYRDIPYSQGVQIEVLSLSMDGSSHPYFTEKSGKSLRINFGDDNFIQKGIHVYKLTYKISNIARAFDDYDEIYWNVTGNEWKFPIEQASFQIFLPAGAKIKSDLVSMYTGKYGSKSSDAVKVGDAFFKTSKILQSGEGFTVAVPFSKGVVKTYDEKAASKAAAPFVVFLAALVLLYYFFTWYKVGREPFGAIVTEFAPPEGISAAFTRCLWKRREDRKMFATALVSLAMKGKIEITEETSFLTKRATLKIKDRTLTGLPDEEKYIISNLFNGRDSFALAQSNWSSLNSCMANINKDFRTEKKKYIIPNVKYITLPILALILMQLSFISSMPALIFVNLHYSIFLLIASKVGANKIISLLVFLAINAFYATFFYSILHEAGQQLWIMQGAFALSLWGLIIYSSAIDNFTAAGKELMVKIKGFYRYMSIAEEHRVALSNPIDAERIFADFLPYAFAFDMENKWMKEFENVLSKAVVDKHLYSVGGRNALARGLILSSINSAAPSNSGRSGSGGGGSSGGGFGGGGGGGR